VLWQPDQASHQTADRRSCTTPRGTIQRPASQVSDLCSAQHGHADLWQFCLAHQQHDLRHAVEAGDTLFAPRLKALLVRAVVLARRRHMLEASTRREHRRRLERELDRVLALQPRHRHGHRRRRRCLAVRDSLFTFLEHPDAPPDNNGSKRDLRPMVVDRKLTGGFRSAWGPDLCAAVKRWSAPPPDAASMPATPSMPSYPAGPFSPG
jgi:transposase